MSSYRIVISGGGTGGHIFPAIAIANALKEKLDNPEILFVGALGKMEMEKVPAAGYKIIGLPIMGLQRRLTMKNLQFPFKLIASMLKARKILKEFDPHIAIGVGGYASGPLLKQAVRLGIPTLIQEQNSYAGITNKLLGRGVNRICVAYENMESFFPKDKIVVTGNPVRQIIQKLHDKRDEAIKHFNLDSSKKTILVIGGSLGARTINKSVQAALPAIQELGVQLIWQTGKLFIDEANQSLEEYRNNGITASAFIEKMDLAYAASDLVISRAGAISVSELCIAGKPVILIPSPNVAEDHQTKNAMALVEKNAAILLKDNEAIESLANKIKPLLASNEELNTLSENIKKMAFIDADKKIADEVLNLIKE